jgi:hypothetical protein
MHIESSFSEKDLKRVSYYASKLPLMFVAILAEATVIMFVVLIDIVEDLLISGEVYFGFVKDKLLLILLIFLVLFLYLFFRTKQVINKGVKNWLKQIGKDKVTYIYDFQENEVKVQTALTESVVKWGLFTKWRKILDYYLLQADSTSYLPIKASDIPSDKLKELETLITTKIRPAASG